VFERKIFFSLKIYGKLAGLSNKLEPSMVFDPSEFEGPRFDLYICKMLRERPFNLKGGLWFFPEKIF
jgi:hypothetical protein